MRRTEVAFVVALAIVVAGIIGADRLLEPRNEARGAERTTFFSESFYCPSPGPEHAGEGVDSLVATTNLGAQPLRLRRSSVGASITSRFDVIDVPPRRRNELSAASQEIPNSVQVVEAFGPASITDQLVVASDSGVASSGCPPGPSNRWLFAAGSTARGKDTYLLIANPFQDEARVRVRIITPNEDFLPSLLKDLIVPALTQTTVLIAEFFQETESFGMDVLATRGRVVVSRFQRIDSRDGLRGATLTTGARRASERWLFAGGSVPAEGEESIVLLNPGASEALVRVAFVGEAESVAPPELQELPLPAGSQVEFDVSGYLARGASHGVELSSTNGVAFIAERRILTPKGSDSVLGLNAPARRWGLSVGSSQPGPSDGLAIVNPTRSRALVRVSLITDQAEQRPPELAAIGVQAGRRVTVDLTGFLAGKSATAVVEAVSGEIVVEHQLTLGAPYRDFASAPGQTR